MTGHVLDACTLLNLHCGWGSVAELRHIRSTFHLPPVIASELQYVRDYDSNGDFVKKALSLGELLHQHPFVQPVPSAEEVELAVLLSRRLDDGEAQGIAIAATRGLNFCSDDAAVHKAVRSEGIEVPLVSTAGLLVAWAGTDVQRLAGLPAIVQRIADLGRFKPHAWSPDLPWWEERLAQHGAKTPDQATRSSPAPPASDAFCR